VPKLVSAIGVEQAQPCSAQSDRDLKDKGISDGEPDEESTLLTVHLIVCSFEQTE